jgi:ABC-type Fe3+/spermidine/putrescine transport system ATPase subunit
MSYLPTLPAILKGVTFNIRAGEKIGVAGRTGAGKSSLIMTLFRLVGLSEGSVRIDGIDVGTFNLGELRRRIAIIPQEPVMFKGTIRSNLDPVSARADDDLRLAVSSNVRGAIAALACQREASPPLLHGLDPIFHAAVAEGDLVVDAGHFLGASFLGNEALRRKPALLADLVEHLGIRAMALEHRDLIVPRPLLVSFAEALAANHIPLVLTNLACEPEAQRLCDAIVDARSTGATFDTPGGVVAFLALIDPTIFDEVPDEARAGLRLEDPVKAMAHAVREARAAGAKHVVVAYEPNPADDYLVVLQNARVGS